MTNRTGEGTTGLASSLGPQSGSGLGFLFGMSCLGLLFVGLGYAGTVSAADDRKADKSDVPGAPDITEVAPSGNKQLDIIWTRPADNGDPIDHYIVQWRTDSEGYDDYYDRSNRSLQTEGESATISGLLGPKDLFGRPIQYRVRVKAVNSLGSSPWSAEVSGQTLTTLAAPGDLRLERIGSNQIKVSWDAPPPDGSSQPNEYTIHYQRSNRPNWNTRRTRRADGNQTTFTTETLPVNATWRFRVAAVNDAGAGSWTSVKTLKLHSRPAAPSDLNVIVGDGRLTAEWALPAGGSSIDGSRLRWRPVGSLTSDWITIEFDKTYELAHTIDGLDNGQAYELAVSTYNPSQSSDWTAAVTATPQAAPTAPTDLSISQRRYDRVDVRWQWPDSDFHSVGGFIVRWRHSTEAEFQVQNRVIVDADTRSQTFYKVPRARSYIVEVIAFGSDDTTYGSVVGVGLTNSPAVIIFDYFREEYEEAEPWIGDAIDSRNFRIAANGRPGYWAYTNPRHKGWKMARTVQLGFSSGVLNGAAYRSGQPVQTVLHELMHVWTYDWPAVENPPALGAMWLYMNQQLAGRCNGGEVLADTLIYPVQLSQGIRYNSYYYRSCSAFGNKPTAEMTEIARSALDGEIHQWFYDTYQLEDGSIDMEQLWYDLRNPEHDQYRFGPRGYLFREMFGGFCSYAEAYESYRSDRDSGAATANPWRDGGCLSYQPSAVTAALVKGEILPTLDPPNAIQLSWNRPLWTKEPTVNGYLVQWKTDIDDGYSDSRQVLLEGLDQSDFLISGLELDTQYKIRLAAVDTANPGLLVSRYGHKRYVEITVTTPPAYDLEGAITNLSR